MTSIYAHGPFGFRALPIEDSFVTLDITAGDGAKIKLIRVTRAEMDALVKAALAARDLLPEPEPEPACTCTDPDCPDPVHQYPADADDDPSSLASALIGSLRSAGCAEPAPPPADRCPICGNRLGADGRHVTQSGAHIDAPAATATLCGKLSFGGGRPCDRPAGHDGSHQDAEGYWWADDGIQLDARARTS